MKRFSIAALWLTHLILAITITGCLPEPKDSRGDQAMENPAAKPLPDNIVEIVTTTMDFKAKDEIPSGWVTFRFINNSAMVHFAVLQHWPDGKGIREHQDTLAPIFQNIMDNINGKPLSVPELGMTPPEWFGQVVFEGGPGLLSRGRTGETTVNLEPGTYLIECYVKSEGRFHSYNPNPNIPTMVHQFNVTEKKSSGKQPVPTINVDISTEKGIEFDGNIEPGNHVVAVHFTDQKLYDNFARHDVHLLKITPETNIDSVANWMNWTRPTGMETPAPPGDFLGGIHEMPAGRTGYFNVELTPGEYAFISEVPNQQSIGMLKRFTVGQGN